MKWRWLGPLLAVVFLYSLAVKTPAALLVAWTLPSGSPLQASGVSGTVSDGRMSALVLRDRLLLPRVHWRLHPLWLLLGRLDLAVDGGDRSLHVDGNLQWGLGGLRAYGLKMTGQLRQILKTAGLPLVPVDALTDLQLGELRWTGGRVADLSGQLQVRHLEWMLAQRPLVLGTYTAVLSTANGGIVVAKLSTRSGQLDVGGSARLTPDHRYRLDLSLKPSPGAPAQLRGFLSAMGPPDLHGVHHYRRSGMLPATL